MIYPVPDPSFPFLGVHFTRRIEGGVWLGPNAVLAFAREGYSRLDDQPERSAGHPGLWGLPLAGAEVLANRLGEMYRDFSQTAFLQALQRYMPELTNDDLLPGPSGVRAQALASDGKMVDDFVIHQDVNIMHVRNAPSPAATSSLAIAESIVDAAAATFDFAALPPALSSATAPPPEPTSA